MLVALDSNIFIAALDPTEEGSEIAQQLLRTVQNGKLEAAYSVIVFGEVLGLASKGPDHSKISDFFDTLLHTRTLSVSRDVAQSAGELRMQVGGRLRLPDALHLATALKCKADVFITNDKSLVKVAGRFINTSGLIEWSKR